MAYGAGARAGDGDRERVAGQLREHYAAGRLTAGELSSRLHAAYAAQTLQELAAVTADLPAFSAPGTGFPAPGAAGALLQWDWGRLRRRLRLAALAGLAVFLAWGVLIAVLLPHHGLVAVLAAVLVLPVLAVAGLVAAAGWIARRAWRSGAWLEAAPVAAGMPWLGRAAWLARVLLAGRALQRAGRRLRRPLRSRRATVYYQDRQDGAWHSAQAGGTRR